MSALAFTYGGIAVRTAGRPDAPAFRGRRRVPRVGDHERGGRAWPVKWLGRIQ